MLYNVADFTFEVDGTDYAATFKPRLVSLQLTEQIEGGADQLEVTLSNHVDKDGKVLPTIKRGAFVRLKLGWKSGPDVTVGLVDKGKFKVDQVEKSGPPDVLRITARSADLTGTMRKRRDKGWTGTTIGEVVKAVAGANGLEARVHADLASIPIPAAEQSAKSDIAFIRDLGTRYDAVSTIKDGKLLFMPIGSDTTAGGKALPAITLKRRDNARYTFTIADREQSDGAEATWRDRGAARGRTVKHGAAKNPKRIKRSFGSEPEARAAAKAAATRAARGQFTLTYEMPLGDAAIEPNRKATVMDFDAEIDGKRWLTKQATHQLDGSGGFTTSIDFESLF